MAKSPSAKRKRTPKSVPKLPDLEQSKTAVLNSLTSTCSQRTYEHAIREFIDWYCSEPRLAFNKTVATRYRIALEQKQYVPATINLRLAAVRRLAYEAADCAVFLPFIEFGVYLFHTSRLPLSHKQIEHLSHHPWRLLRDIWQWEWHALVVW